MNAPNRTPWVTLFLIGTNIVAGFALLWQPDWVEDLGFRAHDPNLIAAFVSLFLHVNVLHLLGNMLFLAAVGPWVEEAAGPWKYLIVYFVGGLLGCAAHAAILGRAGPTEPLIGASGSVAACVGYASVRYASAKVPIAPRVFAPVWAMAGLWLALQAIGALVQVGDSRGGVAFWTHLGGLLAGVLLSLAFREPLAARNREDSLQLKEMESRGPAASLVAADRHLKSHPNDARALRQKAEAHRVLNEIETELETHARLVQVAPAEEVGPSILRLGEADRLGKIAAHQRLKLAGQLSSVSPDAARTLLQSVIDDPRSDQRPDAILALAILERNERPDVSELLIQSLFEDYPMHPASDLARARGFG